MFTETQYLTEKDSLIKKIRELSGNFYSERDLMHLRIEELYKLRHELFNAKIECQLHHPFYVILPNWPFEHDC